MYGEVIIPEAVYEEVVVRGRDKPGGLAVAEAVESGWIQRRSVRDTGMVSLFRQTLGPGESEALTLAWEIQAPRILLDELEARRMSDSLGLPKVGTLGILIQARLEGKISSLRDAILDLRNHCGFRLSKRVQEKALRQVGE
jgi:predicted nucleic acid-binding protein